MKMKKKKMILILIGLIATVIVLLADSGETTNFSSLSLPKPQIFHNGKEVTGKKITIYQEDNSPKNYPLVIKLATTGSFTLVGMLNVVYRREKNNKYECEAATGAIEKEKFVQEDGGYEFELDRSNIIVVKLLNLPGDYYQSFSYKKGKRGVIHFHYWIKGNRPDNSVYAEVAIEFSNVGNLSLSPLSVHPLLPY